MHGIDWNGPLPDEEDAEVVCIPSIENPLSNDQYAELCSSISPYGDSDCFGVDLYIKVVEFVCQKLVQ